MKILFISHDASRTGAPIALLQELNCLCQNGQNISPSVLLLSGGELETDFRKLCPVYKRPKDLIFKRIMRRLRVKRFTNPYLYMFKKGQFDGIYANTVASLELGCQLKAQLAVPLIGHIHEAEAFMYQFPVNPKWVLSCDQIITVSKLSERNLIENYGVSPEKIVIQHPVSLWIRKLMNGEISMPLLTNNDNEVLIGCFVNGNWNKATEIIPLLVKLFNDRYPDFVCKFVLIGFIPKDSMYNLEFDIRRMGIADKIVMQGEVENPLDIFSRLKVLMLPSREESFSLVAQEAGFLKIPIVGFEGATGAAEWIGNDAGILVPYMDLEKMVNALYFLLTNDAVRLQYGEKAKEIVEKMYKNDSLMKNVTVSISKLGCK